jgi:hypothetical protein
MIFILCLIIVFSLSFVVLAGYSFLFVPLMAMILLLSINYKSFWLVVVPSLIIQSGFEKTVYFDREVSFDSFFDISFVPDLWLVVFYIRALFFVIQNLRMAAFKVEKRLIILLFYMLASLLVGTLLFIHGNSPLPSVNKAPIKLILFVLISYFVFDEVSKRNKQFVIDGILIAVFLGAFLRIFIVIGNDVKDPGIYTFIGVFVSAFMLVNAKSFECRLPTNKVFWFVVLCLHMSVSRTEMILFALTLLLLFFSLQNRDRNFFYNYLGIIFLIPIMGVLVIIFVPDNVSNYFLHKLSFFSAYQEGVELGNSASVRLFTFFNLVYGETSSLLNTLFGYGLFGYINFDTFYTSSIGTEGAFSEAELASNEFHKLHFFLNNLIFYFGVIGFFLYNYIFYLFFKNRGLALGLILILYAYLNAFFRPELIVLFPIVLSVFSRRGY